MNFILNLLLLPFKELICEFRAFRLKGELERRYPDPDERALKQKIVLRTDLKMRRGKEIAQGAHASQKLNLSFHFNPYVRLWMRGPFAKIAIGIGSEEELLQLYEDAKRDGLPCSLIRDAGRTEFKNVPTYTAVAIGPGDPKTVERLTGKLDLR